MVCKKMTTFPKYALLLLGNNDSKGRALHLRKSKHILLLIAIIFIVIITIGNYETSANNRHDLVTIASVLEHENIFINEWSLHAREKMDNLNSDEDVKRFINQFKDRFPDWEWKMKINKKHMEAIAELQNGSKIETIKISAPIKNYTETYVIYEVKGQGWNQELENKLNKEIERRIATIFRGNATIFSCIQGEFNDKMNTTLPNKMEKILAAFQATEIESLKEESFISVSSYSTKFQTLVETNGKKMNLQLGMRKNEGDAHTTVVVGTPIITVEY